MIKMKQNNKQNKTVPNQKKKNKQRKKENKQRINCRIQKAKLTTGGLLLALCLLHLGGLTLDLAGTGQRAVHLT